MGRRGEGGGGKRKGLKMDRNVDTSLKYKRNEVPES